jgi:osmotically-inducible protein OsmY
MSCIMSAKAHFEGQDCLARDSGLKSFDISVDTFKDGVKLSGVVSSDQSKARAGEVARGISGVRFVQDDIIVN